MLEVMLHEGPTRGLICVVLVARRAEYFPVCLYTNWRPLTRPSAQLVVICRVEEVLGSRPLAWRRLRCTEMLSSLPESPSW